ncbi:MAG: GIY-YIG nuclease family protein [Anaerolineae bacterium]
MSTIITERFGSVYARGADGQYLGEEALTALIESLVKLRERMALTGQDQQQLLEADSWRITNSLLSSIEVIYPFGAPYAIREVNSPILRPAGAPRYTGVYFLALDQRPHLVKIGQAVDLYERSKGLYQELRHTIDEPRLRPVAFIPTQNLTETEAALHRHFSPVNVVGEWFLREPVEAWLKQFEVRRDA